MSKRAREDDVDPYTRGSMTVEISSTPYNTSDPTSIPPHTPSSVAKIPHLETNDTPLESAMRCSLPGHRPDLPFTSYTNYEVHYTKAHINRCLKCRKNFPSDHLLSLHIAERHDSMVAVRRDRGEKTYACFVEDCEKKCSTPAKRRMHLIAKHGFPPNYDFAVTKDGIDHKTSLLKAGRMGRGGRTSVVRDTKRSGKVEKTPENLSVETGEGNADEENVDAKNEEMNEYDTQNIKEVAEETKADIDMDGLTGAMSSLMFVPSSVRFGRGRGKGRGGFSRS